MMPAFPANNPHEGATGQIRETKSFLAQYESLEAVREFVRRAAKACSFDAKATYAIELATDEAFTNIVEHAYGGESNELVECTCVYAASRVSLTIILHDCGEAFDPTVVAEPNLNAPLEDRETGGLGIYFMHKLMDEVHFSPANATSDGCNTLTMVKRKEKAA